MSGTEIRRKLRAEPFVPFRLRLADGTRHLVAERAALEVVPRELRLAAGRGRPAVTICPRTVVAIEPA